MKTVNGSTITQGRMEQSLNNAINRVAGPQVTQQINEAVQNERIRTGVITKFYPYLDKAEVKLDHNNEHILCKILHRYGGDLIDFYTPVEDEQIFDDKFKEPCIIPRSSQHVLVIKVHDNDSDENLILGYYQNEEVVGYNPAKPGNFKIISLNESNPYWIKFGRDGLDLRLPGKPTFELGELEGQMEDTEYYTKEEVDEIIKNTTDNNSNINYRELLKVTEDYKETSDENKYTLFRGDCWTINNNFESSAAITSETKSDFTITGTFRTKNDMIGIYWYSKDLIEHPFISYGDRSDYRNVTLEFDYSMSGCKDFSNSSMSITLAANTGEVYYLQMNRFINNGHVTIPFSELTLLSGNTYINANGEAVTVTETTPIDVSNLKFIMLVIIPTNYVANNTQYTIMSNVDFTCEISNIEVTNGFIRNEHLPLDPHQYRLCEGYDDFYNFNPYRICKEMRKLGYAEWCDLYIGASHFYEKSGTVDDVINATDFNHTRTEKMTLNKNVPLNKAFKSWLDCYSKELKKNDCPNLVVSVSMENLQCPAAWRQKDCNGNYAETGWTPSTFFYSPCNNEVITYMQSVIEACLDIIVDNGMQPILQMGEAWWWWNENDTPNQPPCFYDDSTKAKYLSKFGENIPEYSSSTANFDLKTTSWLNNQLVNYSDKLREVVKSSKYTKGLYMALFFPPSVTDVDRVPSMMREVNFIKDAYHPDKLDVLQLEDYDWVIGESTHHKEVYKLGKKLGFTEDRLHYFGGFVQYSKDAIKYWRLIQESMDEAISKKFKEVFVWAGTQIRRDKKIIGYENYELVQQLLEE